MVSLRLDRGRGWVSLAVVLVALLAPTGAAGFSKAIWGVPYRNGQNQFPMYRTLGVKIIEADLQWANVAPQSPSNPADPGDAAYHWPKVLEQTVGLAERYHMRVLLQIFGAPRWANGGHPPNWAPEPAAFATFAAAASRHYPSVHLWMIWGEPSRSPNFMPETPAAPGRALNASQRVAPHNYARMLDAAYGSLKQVNRRNLVVGGATYSTGDIDTQQWIANLRLPNGRPPRMDMYAHNPFSAEVPSFAGPASPGGVVQFDDLPRMAGWIDRYIKPGLPIFLSEWTIPTRIDGQFDFYVDPPTAAKWINDAMRISRAWKRIYALGWIHVYDDPPTSYGGLLTRSGKRKPLFDAFAHG